MRRVIKHIFWITIFIGTFLCIPVVLGMAGIEDLSVITKETINYKTAGGVVIYNWTYYKFDIWTYIKELQYSITDQSLTQIIPQFPMAPIRDTSNFDVIGWLKYLTNIVIIHSLNVEGYLLSIMLFAPIKIVFYPARIIITLLGLKTSNYDFVKLFNTIYSFQIPTINYLT